MSPLERTRLVDEVTRRLRDLILDGTMTPGHMLVQTSLAKHLGVSRTPLREALRVLHHEGFVEIVDGNNTLAVVNISVEQMLEYYEIREVVDGLAARLAAQRGVDNATAKRLHVMLTAMHNTLDPKAVTRQAGAHAAFHATIAEVSGNRHVIGQVPMIRFTAQMGSRYVPRHWIEEREGDHIAILDAIEHNDALKAEAVARLHIRNVARRLIQQGSESK
jgi:GntR family transcriptional regulator, vanillate catabolism transcriptional regulator